MSNPLLDAMIAAGWDRVCSAVREAGRRAITEPGARTRLADALRRTAELLETKACPPQAGGDNNDGILQPDAQGPGNERGKGA